MAVFFTSDTHFGDPRALRFDHRPFRSLDDHNEALIARWNETVAESDEVWHLGDFALGPSAERVVEIFAGLNGLKHLIIGNNDGPQTLALPWRSVQHYAEVTEDGRNLVLCHYPLRTWNGIGRGWVDLHGHSHGRLTPIPKQYDVGVDLWEFRPVSLASVLKRRRRAPIGRRSPASVA